MTCRRLFGLSIIVSGLFASTTLTGQSFANGRLAASTNVRFQPGNDSMILLPTTFGLLISEDDGGTFRWVCEDTVGYGGTYDPDYAINEAGDIYATTFDGLKVSTDGSCTYSETNFFGDLTGGTALDPITGHWVGEVEVASDGKIWAATSTGAMANDVYVSTDGTRFDSANNWHATAWWKTIRVSKSSPDVVYVSGYNLAMKPDPAEALLFKTVDGGTSWVDLGVGDFVFGDQPNLILEGISPTDPDIVFARVLGARNPQGDDLYRSTDGGVSFTKVLSMEGIISAFVVRSDGSVLAGTATPCTEDLVVEPDASVPNKGCVRTSIDGSAGSWTTPAIEPRLACLGERPSDQSLFACAGNWDPDNFALGLSADNGDSWSKIVRFAELTGPLECPAGTQQNSCEQLNWPSLCVMLGICGGGPDAGITGSDGGLVVDPPKPGCFDCHTVSGGGYGGLLAILGLAGLGLRRRRQS